MSVEKTFYGKMPCGKDVHSYSIKNSSGACAQIITKGATLDRLFVPDRAGKLTDILVGFDDLEGHVERTDYQGVVVGQYANRIAGGRFTLSGVEYNVTRNEKGITCLHGGGEYSGAVWDAEIISDNAVKFTYFSPDMNEGFPGNVDVSVTYTFTDDNALDIAYHAVSDRDTIINLTNHAYFNLAGHGSILGTQLRIAADYYTPIDENSIPLGKLASVSGTPFDFTVSKEIGRDINAEDSQLKNGAGYDHNFCINGFDGSLRPAAVAYEPASGRVMQVLTTLPGVQLYTGNFLKGVIGKGGKPMDYRTGFCLETQYYPNTPNVPDFPSCVLKKGAEYSSETVFCFSVK
ncbi:MAG: galactose mutarotase [Clostridiales bacterium]|jgi:aldose 1-epimerase|nr:galactose mutarotase [Clostridiales bacterium]